MRRRDAATLSAAAARRRRRTGLASMCTLSATVLAGTAGMVVGAAGLPYYVVKLSAARCRVPYVRDVVIFV